MVFCVLYEVRAFTLVSPSGVMDTLGGEVSSTVMNTDATLDRPALLTVTVKMYMPVPATHRKEERHRTETGCYIERNH